MLKKFFPAVAVTTIIVTLLLIFIGVIVRASGAGLGCPDWPKCFGMWIPPTDAADLPPEFADEEFNVVNTWTEYINRLVGVLVGFLIILTTIFSTAYLKERKRVFVAAFASLVLVIFQGWLGGQVVLSRLEQSMISIHMAVALLILLTLVYSAWHAISYRYRFTLMNHHQKILFRTGWILMILTFAQIMLGTQVREAIDAVDQTLDRSLWLSQVGLIDDIHRTFSWSILIASGWLVYYVKKNNLVQNITKMSFWVLGFVLLQIFIGIVLAYGGMPPAFQVLHLGVSAMLIVAIQLVILASRHHR